jgi:hypothetical protein
MHLLMEVVCQQGSLGEQGCVQSDHWVAIGKRPRRYADLLAIFVSAKRVFVAERDQPIAYRNGVTLRMQKVNAYPKIGHYARL